MQEYNALYGAALVTAADKIDAMLVEAASEGITSAVITTSQVAAMQASLSVNGYSPQAMADAHTLGLTDADLAAMRGETLAARPQDLAGDLVPAMQQISTNYRQLGGILQHPDTFLPGFTVTGSSPVPLIAAAGATNAMVQVYDTSVTMLVANPSSQPATIDLSVRPISLPAGWTADVSPAQVTLAANTQTSVTLTIHPAYPVPQGFSPQVAVEGYSGGQLIDGVVVQTLVPYYAPFDGSLHQYLPFISR
jgi:hypothetical protein